MRKVQFLAVVLTLAIATPMTILALVMVAYTTDHLIEISTAVANFSRLTTAGGRGWVLEFAQRWPELVGMVIGQLVLLTILLFARQSERGPEVQNPK